MAPSLFFGLHFLCCFSNSDRPLRLPIAFAPFSFPLLWSTHQNLFPFSLSHPSPLMFSCGGGAWRMIFATLALFGVVTTQPSLFADGVLCGHTLCQIRGFNNGDYCRRVCFFFSTPTPPFPEVAISTMGPGNNVFALF